MIGGDQPWSPLIGQDCARGCPLLAPRGAVVHHQHERLEHAHVLLPLGHQVVDHFKVSKPDCKIFCCQRIFRANKAQFAAVPVGAAAPAAGARPHPRPQLGPRPQPGLGQQTQPRVPAAVQRQQHSDRVGRGGGEIL